VKQWIRPANAPFCIPLPDPDGVIIGVAGVHDHGQPLWRPRDMGAEIRELFFPGRMFVEIIQPGFTNPDDFGMAGFGQKQLVIGQKFILRSCGWTPTLHQTLSKRSATAPRRENA